MSQSPDLGAGMKDTSLTLNMAQDESVQKIEPV